MVTGNENVKIVYRFTSNQDQIDHRPILHKSLNTFKKKMLCFVIIYNL